MVHSVVNCHHHGVLSIGKGVTSSMCFEIAYLEQGTKQDEIEDKEGYLNQ
jgi:hypothetical protein